MSNIKEKISASIDKLTHRHGNTSNTNTGTTTGTGVGSDYNQTSIGSAGTPTGATGAYTTSGTGTGLGNTGGVDTTTGTGYGAGTTTGAYDTTTTTGATTGTINASEIIDSKTFTKTEDHEVLIEKKRYELEHRPVEKQYVVETRFVGERRVPGAPVEVVGKEAREVDERVVQAPRGDRTVIVQDVDVPAGEVRELAREVTGGYNTTGTTGGFGTTGAGLTGTQTATGTGIGQNKYDSTTGPSATGREI